MIFILLLSLITSTAAGRDYNAQQHFSTTGYRLPIIIDDAAIRNTITLHAKTLMAEQQKKLSGNFYTEAAALRAKAAAKYPPTAKEIIRQLKRCAALTVDINNDMVDDLSTLRLSDRVSITKSSAGSERLEGIVAYVGAVSFASGDDWVGIQLTGDSIGKGKNDGSVGGVLYFKERCQANHGLFVRRSALSLLQSSSSTTAGGLTTTRNNDGVVVVGDNDLGNNNKNNQQGIDADDANPNDREQVEREKNGDHHNKHNLYERYCGEGSVFAICHYRRCCNNCDNWVFTTASAFAVSKTGIVATNYHVIDHNNEEGIFLAIDQNLNVYPITAVLAADERFDTALVQLGLGRRTCSSGVVGKELESFPPPIPLASHHASIGSPVTVISHPGGNYFMLTRGVAARYAFSHGGFMEKSPPESKPVIRNSSSQIGSGNSYNLDYSLFITAEYASGSSGAPVYNEQGQVVGMASMAKPIYANGNKELQMVIKECVPSSAIVRLLSQISQI